jgi:hypothetical protein
MPSAGKRSRMNEILECEEALDKLNTWRPESTYVIHLSFAAVD